MSARGVAIVTGAGRGVGRATAIALAAAGHPVGLISRTGSELDRTTAVIEGHGGTAVAAVADVTDEAELDAAFDTIESSLGAASLLVTMAGTAQTIGPLWNADPASWWSDVEANLRGTFLACRRAVPAMIAAGAGRVVTVGTYGLNRPMPYLSAYAAAKGGVAALAEALHAEAAEHGVKVFLITPGTARTSMFDHLSTSTRAGAGCRRLPSARTRWSPRTALARRAHRLGRHRRPRRALPPRARRHRCPPRANGRDRPRGRLRPPHP